MGSCVTSELEAAEFRADSLGTVDVNCEAAQRETMTIEAAASRLGIGRSLAYQLAREDRFPCAVIRAGRRLLVPRLALERLLRGESRTGDASAVLPGRDATVADLRSELQLRESCALDSQS
jgi:excisionase family DNA binding protein